MTQKAGYYKPEIIEKFNAALKDASAAVKAGTETRVRISNSNSKMGAVTSVSTLPFITCPECCEHTCGAKCYAAKLANLRPTVLKSYAINTALAIYKPAEFWKQVSAAACAVRFFRFHVSGDIMGKAYFMHMIDTCRGNPKTEFLCFTKQFEIVNNWISENGALPENLHILFSGWSNLVPVNPHKLPETNVISRGESSAWWDLPDNWKLCGGNCFNCACRGMGCWQAVSGDVIAFKEH